MIKKCILQILPEAAIRKIWKNAALKKKIDSDPEYAAFLEQLILEKDFLLSAALGYAGIKTKKTFRTKVCVRTLYSYIDKGVFKSLSNKNLPVQAPKRLMSATSLDTGKWTLLKGEWMEKRIF